MFKRFLKNQRGLTLVELLAVIVILGIIAAIAVPSIGGLINKTKDDSKVAEAVQIINAAKLAHASKANKNTWTHNGKAYGTTYAEGNKYKIGPALEQYLDSVDDNKYAVVYEAVSKSDSTMVYKIVGHNAATVLKKSNDADTAKISEEDLLKFTND